MERSGARRVRATLVVAIAAFGWFLAALRPRVFAARGGCRHRMVGLAGAASGASASRGNAARQDSPAVSAGIASSCSRLSPRTDAGPCSDVGPRADAAQPGDDPQEPATAAAAQANPIPWRNVKFGATFEGYYQYNWNRPPDRISLLRAYDTRAQYLQHPAGRARGRCARRIVDAGRRFGARVDLQFGQATETVQGSAANEPRPDVYRDVWQAYGTYVFPVGRRAAGRLRQVRVDARLRDQLREGQPAFSRAYLFNFLPFYHSGLRLTLPVNDRCR